MKLINIGFGNMVSAGRVVAVVSPGFRPGQAPCQGGAERGMLIDGRRPARCSSDHVVLSALQPETVANRAAGQEGKAMTEEETSHGE